jgi:hypothetical protein
MSASRHTWVMSLIWHTWVMSLIWHTWVMSLIWHTWVMKCPCFIFLNLHRFQIVSLTYVIHESCLLFDIHESCLLSSSWICTVFKIVSLTHDIHESCLLFDIHESCLLSSSWICTVFKSVFDICHTWVMSLTLSLTLTLFLKLHLSYVICQRHDSYMSYVRDMTHVCHMSETWLIYVMLFLNLPHLK